MKNFKILLIIFIFLNGCGFTPIYKLSEKDIKFTFDNLDFTGDGEINKYLKQNLDSYYRNNDQEQKLNVKISSEFKKKELTKNTLGKVLNYEMSISVKFDISSKSINKIVNISDSFVVKNDDSNILDQKQYEIYVKKSLSQKIVNQLIIQIIMP